MPRRTLARIKLALIVGIALGLIISTERLSSSFALRAAPTEDFSRAEVISLTSIEPKTRITEENVFSDSRPTANSASQTKSRSAPVALITNREGKGAVSFLIFDTEVARFLKALPCPRASQSVSPASDDLGPLFGCVIGKGQTAKYWVNGSRDGTAVENVKVMWNDWQEDGGTGLHADAEQAQQLVEILSKLYMPTRKDELLRLFKGQEGGQIAAGWIVIEYRFHRGPKIDERLLTLTTTSDPALAQDKLLSECNVVEGKLKTALTSQKKLLSDLQEAIEALRVTMTTSDRKMMKLRLSMAKITGGLLTIDLAGC